MVDIRRNYPLPSASFPPELREWAAALISHLDASDSAVEFFLGTGDAELQSVLLRARAPLLELLNTTTGERGTISLNNGALVLQAPSVSIADDAVKTIAIPESGWVRIWSNGSTFLRGRYTTAGVWSDVAAFGAATTTGALTGTTGTDAQLNVSYNSGILYIENREGSTKTYNILIEKGTQ